MIKKQNIFFLAFLSIVIHGCSQNRLFDEVQKIPHTGWAASDSKKFTVSVSDTSQAYDIFLHIRNSTSYNYSNLWLFVKTSAPNGDHITDTLEFFLADPSGHWLGKGLGSINSMLIPYKQNIRFPFRGIYTFEFQQAMRKEVLSGIMDIGLRVQPHQ